jgi:hypothetical protein
LNDTTLKFRALKQTDGTVLKFVTTASKLCALTKLVKR